jgi:hypothetical protein
VWDKEYHASSSKFNILNEFKKKEYDTEEVITKELNDNIKNALKISWDVPLAVTT